MPAILLASACPVPTVFSGSIFRNTGMTTNALVAPAVPEAVTFIKQVNQLGAVSDQGNRAGAGLIGVPDNPQKIVLGVGSGLLLAVGAGYAMIGGPVEIATATTLAVPNNTSRVWIWYRQTGPVLACTTTTTPPAGECCLLGSCVTSGGAITSVDTSGVMYLRGGIGWRESADQGAPTDTPPSNIQFFAKTGGGTYFWTGTAYTAIGTAVAATIITASDQTERFETIERKFRALLGGLLTTIGEDFLITDELIDDLDTANAEV